MLRVTSSTVGGHDPVAVQCIERGSTLATSGGISWTKVELIVDSAGGAASGNNGTVTVAQSTGKRLLLLVRLQQCIDNA